MRLGNSLLALVIVVILLVTNFGCQTPTATKSLTEAPAPSTPGVSPPNPVTPSAVQQSATPSPTPTPKPSVPLKPAKFVLGDLTITPAAVTEGDEVTYSIQVSNTGGTEGSYTVVFKYKSSGGSTGSDNVEVTLMPGQTKTATFTTTKNESGTYFINVNDKGSQYTVTPRLATKPLARQTKIEVVTKNAAAINPKGGQQSRIVHTQDGVFTAYIVEGNSETSGTWKLAQRQSDGTWAVIAQGESGGTNVNLLASPDGTLHVIGWSNGSGGLQNGIGIMYSGKPKNGTLVLTSTKIPNVAEGIYARPSAGIDANGNICVESGVGASGAGGELRWAYYVASKLQWVTQTNKLDYMYAYAFVFPSPDGQVSLVATRDVPRTELGYTYTQPQGVPPWIFNAFRYWRINNIYTDTIKVLSYAEEVPTDQYTNPFLNVKESYLDTKDRMHILYSRSGATTGGRQQYRHRIVSASGTTLFDEELPQAAGQFCRIFQDSQERFYLLGQSGLLYPMDQEGQTLGSPMKLDLDGHEVEFSGYALSVPRTGTPLSDVMDVCFPSDGGESWFYFQLDFSGK